MAINKQFVFYDDNFVPNPFEVSEKNIEFLDMSEVPKNLGVYIIKKKDNQIYIGKSTYIPDRFKSHEMNGMIRKTDSFTFFTSDCFNESHISTLETRLINHSKYFNVKILLNTRLNQKEYMYFNKTSDEKIYKKIIEEFHNNVLSDFTHGDYKEISESQEYKISPKVNVLTKDQSHILEDIEVNMDDQNNVYLLTGKPGTGKSVLAAKIADELSKTSHSVLLTSGLTNLNKIFKRSFKGREYKNITVENTGVAVNKFYRNKKQYDWVIIDEGHRLKKVGTGKASGYTTGHITNRNELEDLLKVAKNAIILFDKNQIAMPVDITTKELLLTLDESEMNINKYTLDEQLRNDDEYENWIENLLSSRKEFKNESNIEIKVYEDFSKMYQDLKSKKSSEKSSILVSTPFTKNKQSDEYHFDIDGVQLRWSAKSNNWSESNAAKDLKEVGYVGNVQGKEFQNVGLIIGNDFFMKNGILEINSSYKRNHFQFIKGEEELNRKIAINRLRIFLSRATEKISIYIMDEELREYIKRNI